ncbi:hypothetical protein PGT21_018920 [Puccinia graminis f. sp. tritici]|uniref:Uncharacterized protein n=1 Tax=Puccinia graminis f. sp. tritici TaxID=56615 RepID=A0A5B0QWF1_PUCGR|nr:hypothetical protein PGT21_011894 [Puccinia graminis f. sp. tritici]KAA1117661.1 hypothetical protein PGT21_018920 [Puccinia graminis f. sp. tritici]KAA1138123.1 hypothetical protein PGTUg99_031624 [Puccinia graminis f. sp. tritici]
MSPSSAGPSFDQHLSITYTVTRYALRINFDSEDELESGSGVITNPVPAKSSAISTKTLDFTVPATTPATGAKRRFNKKAKMEVGNGGTPGYSNQAP